MNYDVGVFTRRRIISPAESYFAAPAVSTYVGPGDAAVYGGTTLAWYGLRAFSAATIGTNAVRLDNGGTQKNVITKSDGTLDMSDGSFFTGGPYSVLTWYNQAGTGSGFDLTVAVSNYFLVLDSGIPSISKTSSFLVNASSFSAVPPITFSMVARSPGLGGANNVWEDNSNGALFGLNPGGSANLAYIAAGGSLTATAADSAFHAVQASDVSTNARLYVDGSPTGPSTVTGLALVDHMFLDLEAGFKIRELGAWASDQTAQFSAMNTNQHTFWGF